MPLPKLVLRPENSSYTVKDGVEVASTALDGGASRRRLDQLGSVYSVNASFVLNSNQYQYLRSFYKTVTASGSLPFLIDLIINEPDLTEYTAYFVEGSLQLQYQKGLTYSASCSFEVLPNPIDAEFDQSFVDFYALYGENYQSIFDMLEYIANHALDV